MKISDRTLRDWRRDHPDFAAEMDEAGRAFDRHIGHLARTALEKQLIAMNARERPRRQAIVQKTAEVVELEEPFQFDVASVRTGLTKLDPTWTHPAKEPETGPSDAQAILRRARELMQRDAG